MTYTILTLALIGIVLLFWLNNLIKNCFSRSFCILKNRKSKSIETKEASIISVKTIKKGEKPLLELMLLFENFSGSHIHRKIRVWDSKPHLHRFEQDKSIPIGLNIARKPKDPIFLSQEVCRFSFVFVIICILKILVYVIGSYILISEALEKIFSSPEKYEFVLGTSQTWQIGLILIGVSVLLYLLLQRIGVLVNGKTNEQNWNLLYYGVGTTANIIDHKDTEPFIKNDTAIQFSYAFKTSLGKQFEGFDKKIIDDADVDSLLDSNQLDVMYLPNDPKVSRIKENLESQDFVHFLNRLFLIVVFIFSVVFVFSFYKTVFGA